MGIATIFTKKMRCFYILPKYFAKASAVLAFYLGNIAMPLLSMLSLYKKRPYL